MRIGILTLPLHTNYGGILQAYALQTVLERMGHQVVVFGTTSNKIRPIISRILFFFHNLPIIGKQVSNFMNRHQGIAREVISHNIQTFIDRYVYLKEIHRFKELNAKDYDALIVGSDQVWRPIYFPRWQQPIENAFLSFAQDWKVMRIAYAASFGTNEWEYSDKQTQICKKLLHYFDAISVREENGVKLCKKYFDVDALQVLDPTMLLVREDYIRLLKKNNTPKSKGNLLNYVLDSNENIIHLIDKLAVKKHLIPFSVNNPFEYDDTKPLNMRIKLSVESWLRGFYDAKFVVTDSFHACVFSILFKKQFVVVGNRERGMARFESLLQMFGLENRLVPPDSEVCSLPMINYDVVYKKYDKLKEMSFAFLQNALKNKMK